MYSAEVLDHFEHPRNGGVLSDADASAQMENPACGDTLRLMLKMSAGRIVAMRFLARGCVPVMACGSALTELVQGRTIAEARRLSREELLRAVGGLPAASQHASHLALDTLAAVLAKLNGKS